MPNAVSLPLSLCVAQRNYKSLISLVLIIIAVTVVGKAYGPYPVPGSSLNTTFILTYLILAEPSEVDTLTVFPLQMRWKQSG